MERIQIINKTTSLIKRYGIKSMTLDAISKQIGITKKTIYIHFSTKDELLLECLNLINDTIDNLWNIAKLDSKSPVITLIKAYNYSTGYLSQFHSTFYFDVRKSPKLRIAIQNHIKAYKLNRIHPLLLEAKKSKLLSTDVDLEAAVDCYMKFIPHFFVNFKDNQAVMENHLTLFLNHYFNYSYNDQK